MKLLLTPQNSLPAQPLTLSWLTGGNADGYAFDNTRGNVGLFFKSSVGGTVTIVTPVEVNESLAVEDLTIDVPGDGSIVHVARLQPSVFNSEDTDTNLSHAVTLQIPADIEFAIVKEV